MVLVTNCTMYTCLSSYLKSDDCCSRLSQYKSSSFRKYPTVGRVEIERYTWIVVYIVHVAEECIPLTIQVWFALKKHLLKMKILCKQLHQINAFSSYTSVLNIFGILWLYNFIEFMQLNINFVIFTLHYLSCCFIL